MNDQNAALSEREIEIIRLVATGAPNKEIATQLVISPNTVKVHVRNIFAKIGVTTRTEATLYAIRMGWIDPALVKNAALLTSDTLEADAAEITRPVVVAAGPPAALPAPKRYWIALLAIFFGLLVITTGGLVINRSFSSATAAPSPAPTASLPASQVIIPVLPSGRIEAVPLIPAPARWNKLEALPEPRKGMASAAYETYLYLIGGETKTGISTSTLQYDITSQRWQTLTDKPTPVTDVQAAVIAEKIYVPGGRLADGSLSNKLEVFDLRQNRWETRGSLPAGRSGYALAALEGKLYLFGGWEGSTPSAAVWEYDPGADRWQARTALPTRSAWTSAAATGGKIYLSGGWDGQNALSDHWVYLPFREGSSETPYKKLASLPSGRYAGGMTGLTNILYLLGGSAGKDQPLPGALEYLVEQDTWIQLGDSLQPIGVQAAVISAGNNIHILGGEEPDGTFSLQHQTYQAIYTIGIPIIQNR